MFPEKRCNLQQVTSSNFGRDILPFLERSGGGFNSFVREFGVGFMDKPDYLVIIRGVRRSEHVASLVALSSDDQGKLATELGLDVGDGLSHCSSIALDREVGK